MSDERFTVRGLDGVVRTYDGSGKRVHGGNVPEVGVELRPERPQVEECRRLSAFDDERKARS